MKIEIDERDLDRGLNFAQLRLGYAFVMQSLIERDGWTVLILVI